MNQKTLFYASAIFLLFLSLIFFNYRQAQIRLKDTRPSLLSISLLNPPRQAPVNIPVNVAWHVQAPPSFYATTTIYWGYDSSPSALTKLDSPQAVAYPNSAPDYASGRFPLPGNFDLNLTFPKPGTVYLRAFAQVGNNYLWTPEQSLIIK